MGGICSCVSTLISMRRAADPNFRNYRACRLIRFVRQPERDTCVSRGTVSCGRERRASYVGFAFPHFSGLRSRRRAVL